MAPTPRELFRKTVTKTGASKRMNFPIEKLHHLPPFQNGLRKVQLQIEDEAGRVYPIGCTVSRKPSHKKPVFSAGWTKVVRALGLEVGDEMTFFELGEGNLKLQLRKANEVRQHVGHELENNNATLKNGGKEEKEEINYEDGKTFREPIKVFGAVIGYGPVRRPITLFGVVIGWAAA